MNEPVDPKGKREPIEAGPSLDGVRAPPPLVKCPACGQYLLAEWDADCPGEIIVNPACRCVRRLDVAGIQVVKMALEFERAARVHGRRPRPLRIIAGGGQRAKVGPKKPRARKLLLVVRIPGRHRPSR
ncbi:MAG TPA: hypothetical protein VFU23_02285 [Gemmatimonadales bacterium]|nr:hypothetical protein [Gemmatimonadales bacterium]